MFFEKVENFFHHKKHFALEMTTLITYFYFSGNSCEKRPAMDLYVYIICCLLNLRENTFLKKNTLISVDLIIFLRCSIKKYNCNVMICQDFHKLPLHNN